MHFNKKIANKILSDLNDAKALKLSPERLGANICQNLAAIDNTFPRQLRVIIEGILSKIEDFQEEQYAATLNTPQEGMRDLTLSVGNLFDHEIACLEEYLAQSDDYCTLRNLEQH